MVGSKASEVQHAKALMLLTILHVAAETASFPVWAGCADPAALLDVVLPAAADGLPGAAETAAALGELVAAAEVGWPAPASLRTASASGTSASTSGTSRSLGSASAGGVRKAGVLDTATGSAATEEWHMARTHRRERLVSIRTQLGPSIKVAASHGGAAGHVQPPQARASSPKAGSRGRSPRFMVSSPTRSPGRWLLDPELADELNEGSGRPSYGRHH